MRKLFLLSVISVLIQQICTAQTVRKYSNEFLSIGVSAEALGMGGSVVAGVDNVTAGYWNPAGLSLIKADYQVGIMHSEYFAGIAKYDYGAFAMPLKDKKSAIALSIIRFGVDDIPNTLFLIGPDGSINYDNITSFSVADYGFLGSYATRMKWNNLRVGFNAKVVHRTAGYFATAWGFGLDAGAQMDKNNWQFGLMLRDITSTFNAWSFGFTEADEQILAATGNAIPENSLEITTPKVIFGTGYLFDMGENFGGKAEVNLDITTDGKRNVLVSASPFSMDPHMGLEFNYKNFIYLRGGVNNLQQAIADDSTEESWIIQPNMGVGLVIGPVTLDYAYTNIGNQGEILYSHVVSLSLDFYKKVAPLKNQ